MTRKITDRTPKEDGFFMPAEFTPQDHIYMIWPKRKDNWRDGAKPAQKAYRDVALAICEFTPVTMLADYECYEEAKKMLGETVRVVEMTSDDAWCRDCGPSVLVNHQGQRRGCDWRFNAWGGMVDGLYSPWEADDAIAGKICELEGMDYYSLKDFVLEGGSFHVDGRGSVLTTEMCLLSKGRNPGLSKEEIEKTLLDYLGASKVLWLKDGIDPEETNGHVDDVACFVRPHEVACIYTEDEEHPFYSVAKENYETLCHMKDSDGEILKVHKVCLPKHPVLLEGAETIEEVEGTIPRKNGDICIASYLNFLITNEGVIVPQYGDEHDAMALEQIQGIFPEKKVVGVFTREIVYGGGNIHCITQQIPSPLKSR
ncbi:MAG: agmatine deiminase [Lachnospiraceae bacterium]|nr:agmatine deiminase [Lachnospiraceae bacterium]